MHVFILSFSFNHEDVCMCGESERERERERYIYIYTLNKQLHILYRYSRKKHAHLCAQPYLCAYRFYTRPAFFLSLQGQLASGRCRPPALSHLSGGVFNGTPIAGWFISWKIVWKLMILGAPPISGNLHMDKPYLALHFNFGVRRVNLLELYIIETNGWPESMVTWFYKFYWLYYCF